MIKLTDFVVVVTGGAGLIGQSFVRRLLEEDAQVIIAEKDCSRAENFLASLDEEKKRHCSFIEMDITSTQDVVRTIDYVHSKFGKINGLINNAYPRNKSYGADFYDVNYDNFCENISFNIGGYFLCCQKFSNYFEKQGSGNIVNIASIYGVCAPRFEIYNDLLMTMPVEYAAIKSAIIHLTKYIAKYLKGKNIRVNSLSPGGIQDNHQMEFLASYGKQCLNKGMLDPQDLCGTLVFLLSDESKYINGQNLVVDDGFTL